MTQFPASIARQIIMLASEAYPHTGTVKVSRDALKYFREVIDRSVLLDDAQKKIYKEYLEEL